jgi:uncharacterized Zn finger protein (UPF0148 family)
MKIRGRRECKNCGRRWSYYDTGEVACPDCGSLRSVGVDERTRHTDSPVELDLSEHRSAFGERPPGEFADDLKSTLRSYRRERGFVAAGELRDLDETYLAASELLHAADVYARLRDPDESEQVYLLTLLRGADRGDRPPVADVPDSMTDARGLGYAEAVAEYRRDVSTWLEDNPDPEARRAMGTVRERVKRVQALQGDVPPEHVERLVTSTREVARYLREGDEASLSTALDRLERL